MNDMIKKYYHHEKGKDMTVLKKVISAMLVIVTLATTPIAAFAATEPQGDTITAEQAVQLEEARKVVQTFIDNTEPLGINDNLGNEKLIGMNDVDEEMLIGMNNTLIYDSFHGEKSGKYYTEEVYDSLSEKERFYCRYLSVAPLSSINLSSSNLRTSDVDFSLRRLSYFPEIEEEVVAVWQWLYEQGQTTGSMPDLFEVYMDMKNGVEYEIIEDTDEITSEVTAESLDEENAEPTKADLSTNDLSSEADNEENMSDNEQPESGISSKKETTKIVNYREQKGFADILKDNIITIILAVALVVAVIIVIKLTKDKKKAENNK